MHFKAILLSAMLFSTHLHLHLNGDEQLTQKKLFKPFTGKLTRNKVRLRLQPNLDGQILREMAKDDLLVVIDEEDEFYAVLPPQGTKAYVFRTYVIDNTIEGNHVNVRLEPDTESAVISQLNSGDKVEGIISPLNSKWLEIAPPPSAHFFVCKEYVDNVGDATMIVKLEKRKEEVNTLLNSSHMISQSEFQKPFEHMNLESVLNNLTKITQLYSDFPDQVMRAKEMLAKIQENYLQKKIAYLEAKAGTVGSYSKETAELPIQAQNQQKQLTNLENSFENIPAYTNIEIQRIESTPTEDFVPHYKSNIDWTQAFDPGSKTDKMTAWIPTEKDLYDSWSLQHDNATLRNYYNEQYAEGIIVRGLVEPYYRPVKNKPGDFILVNKGTNLPIAYLYSTQVNLQDLIGKEATMRVSPRPNNHFAFPAYFVLSTE